MKYLIRSLKTNELTSHEEIFALQIYQVIFAIYLHELCMSYNDDFLLLFKVLCNDNLMIINSNKTR